MKKLILLQLILFLITLKTVVAVDNVIISQVLYNPTNTESGGEAVELFNPTSSAIDISGWVLATETSPTDITLPTAVISGGGYYLVADVGWSVSKDDASWSEADHEEIMTLTNVDAGVALSNGTDIIDAVGWGAALGIGSGLYEGTPHGGSNEGEALVRVKNSGSYVDTDNNLNDFVASIPDFHNSSFGQSSFSSTEITIVAIVQGSFPVINSFTILTDDDSSSVGNQIHPVPRQNKTVEVESVVSHDNGNGYVNSVVINIGGINISMAKQQELTATTAKYNAKFNMSYYTTAGNYTANLTVTDNGGLIVNSVANFEYASLIAIHIDTASLQFAAMPGMVSEIIGDADEATTTNATIQNIGNTFLDIELSGTNLTSSTGVIDVSNIQYTFNGDYNNSLAGVLSYAKQTKQLAMEAASVLPLSFKLSIPTATAPGNYTGTITLMAVQP